MELLTVTVSGLVVSVLTSLFKTAKLTKGQRSGLALALSVLGGLVSVLMSGELNGVQDLATMAVATFAASQIVYTGVLKNTDVNSKIEVIDVFTSSNKAKVEKVADAIEKATKKAPAKKAAAKKATAPKK